MRVMYKVIIGLALGCFYSLSAFAFEMSTSRIDLIKEQLNKLEPGDLLVTDVMAVLFHKGDQLITESHKDRYLKFLHEIGKKEGKKKEIFLETIVKQSFHATPVDPLLIDSIKEVMGRKVKYVILTSGRTGERGVIPSLEDLRIKRIQSLGIDVSKMFDLPSQFDLEDISDFKEGVPSRYDRGVIFTHKNNKGETLKAFLKEAKFKPKRILFIDNQMRQVDSVRKAADSLGIEFIGIHYTKAYELGAGPLDEEIAAKQMEYLKNKSTWLTDKQARCMIDHENDFQFCKDS